MQLCSEFTALLHVHHGITVYDKYRLIVMVLYIYYSIYDVYMGLCLDRSRYLYRTIDLISNIQYIYTYHVNALEIVHVHIYLLCMLQCTDVNGPPHPSRSLLERVLLRSHTAYVRQEGVLLGAYIYMFAVGVSSRVHMGSIYSTG